MVTVSHLAILPDQTLQAYTKSNSRKQVYALFMAWNTRTMYKRRPGQIPENRRKTDPAGIRRIQTRTGRSPD
jgi:hypothetical protein